MDSGMIGKILKAKQYSQEPDRIEFTQFAVTFHGEHSDHRVTYKDGKWTCECNFFASHDVCSHTMALERILGAMLHPRDESSPEVEQASQPL